MRSCTPSDGVTAGFLAGAAVMVVYFVIDLIHLDPLATPTELSRIVLRPGGSDLDLPVLARVVTFAEFGVRLLAFTVLHFLVFAVLGVFAAFCQRRIGVPNDVVTGALYGLVVCTATFYGSLGLVGSAFRSIPGLASVLLANLLAGAIMGGYLQLSGRLRTE